MILHLFNVVGISNLRRNQKKKIFGLPTQQSAELAQLLPDDEKSVWQLLLPHVRLPEQCESKSQSPPPTAHGLVLEQQLQSVVGTPSQFPEGGGTVVAVVATKYYKLYCKYFN